MNLKLRKWCLEQAVKSAKPNDSRITEECVLEAAMKFEEFMAPQKPARAMSDSEQRIALTDWVNNHARFVRNVGKNTHQFLRESLEQHGLIGPLVKE